jgi:hypothetical protein
MSPAQSSATPTMINAMPSILIFAAGGTWKLDYNRHSWKTRTLHYRMAVAVMAPARLRGLGQERWSRIAIVLLCIA